MELSGFRVSIHSDGEELKEYSVEVSPDGKKATCWVPSQSGKVRHVRMWVNRTRKLRCYEELRGEISDRGILGHRARDKGGTRSYGWAQDEEVCIAPGQERRVPHGCANLG